MKILRHLSHEIDEQAISWWKLTWTTCPAALGQEWRKLGGAAVAARRYFQRSPPHHGRRQVALTTATASSARCDVLQLSRRSRQEFSKLASWGFTLTTGNASFRGVRIRPLLAEDGKASASALVALTLTLGIASFMGERIRRDIVEYIPASSGCGA